MISSGTTLHTYYFCHARLNEGKSGVMYAITFIVMFTLFSWNHHDHFHFFEITSQPAQFNKTNN